jgi:hypothetical protein
VTLDQLAALAVVPRIGAHPMRAKQYAPTAERLATGFMEKSHLTVTFRHGIFLLCEVNPHNNKYVYHCIFGFAGIRAVFVITRGAG